MPRSRGVRKTIEEKIQEKEQSVLELTEKLTNERKELEQLYNKLKEKQTTEVLKILNEHHIDINQLEEIIKNHLEQTNQIIEEMSA